MTDRRLELVDQPMMGRGYDSHIRGTGNGYARHHIFPGLMMAGNEAGANAPIYAHNPDAGVRIEIDRRFNQLYHPWHNFHIVRL